MLCNPELTVTLAKAIAKVLPASLDEWFGDVGAELDESLKEGDLVVVQRDYVTQGTVAMAVKVFGYDELQFKFRLDGKTEQYEYEGLAFHGGPLGFTLLHAAAALKCSAAVISALLEEGQSAAATDALGRTPLAVALEVNERGVFTDAFFL